MHLCVKGISAFVSSSDFSIGFWNYPDSGVFLFLLVILSAIMFSLYVLYYDICFS